MNNTCAALLIFWNSELFIMKIFNKKKFFIYYNVFFLTFSLFNSLILHNSNAINFLHLVYNYFYVKRIEKN